MSGKKAGGRRYDLDEYDDGYGDEYGVSYEDSYGSPSMMQYMAPSRVTTTNDEEDVEQSILDVQSILGEHETNRYSYSQLSEWVRFFQFDSEKMAEYIRKDIKKKDAENKAAILQNDDMFGMDDEEESSYANPRSSSAPSSVFGGTKNTPIAAANAKTVSKTPTPKAPAGGSPKKQGNQSSPNKKTPDQSSKTDPKARNPIVVTTANQGSLNGGNHQTTNASIQPQTLGHELLTPGYFPPGSTVSGSNTLSLLSSSELTRSGSKNKLTKQMPEAKREKTLKDIAAESTTAGLKTHLNMVVIGHVDSGKSTTMGHLLYQMGIVDKKTIDKFEQDSKNIGKPTFHFAWVMDEQAEERSRGVTIDVAVQHIETEKHKITILDAPGHQDFVPNMIAGASQADVAVLVVNASDSEYQTILDLGSAKEHILLARSLGVVQLIVAINKLDTCKWSQERFDYVKNMILPFLKTSGNFKEAAIQFVPTSGLMGENLTSQKDPLLTAWYKGPTLLSAINNFAPPKRDYDKAFRMSVHEVYRDPHALGITVAGRIESGFVTKDDNLLLLPLNQIVRVKALRIGQHIAEKASAGANAEIGLLDVEISSLNTADVLCDPMAPVPLVNSFRAQLATFDIETPLIKGFNIEFHAGNLNEPAKVQKLVAILDASGAIKKINPRMLTSKCTALVDIHFQRRIPVELFKDFRGFGRFTIRQQGKTLGAGIITDLDPASLIASASNSSFSSSLSTSTSSTIAKNT